MDKRALQTIQAQVYRKFPEMEGVEPSVHEKVSSPSALGSPPRRLYVLTFKKVLRAEGGVPLRQIVRVTVDENGEVLKLITSR